MIKWALPATLRRDVSTPPRSGIVELVDQDDRVDHHAVADDRGDVQVEDAARHQLELEHLAVDDEGVAALCPPW